MPMVALEDFKPLSLGDKVLFDAHYAKYPPTHSDFMFTTMVCWSALVEYTFLFKREGLTIMFKVGGKTHLRPPFGPRDKEGVTELLKLSAELGLERPLVELDADTKMWLEHEMPTLKFDPLRDFFDYVYLATDLRDLPGKRYLNIRNQLNHFQKTYKYDPSPIEPKDLGDIKDFLARWCKARPCTTELMEHENKAAGFAVEHFVELGLGGIIIRIDGHIQALSVFEPLNKDTVVIHVEKAMPEYKGLYQAINREAARVLADRFTYIDRESDMGDEGLRTAKLKYGHHHFIELYAMQK